MNCLTMPHANKATVDLVQNPEEAFMFPIDIRNPNNETFIPSDNLHGILDKGVWFTVDW